MRIRGALPMVVALLVAALLGLFLLSDPPGSDSGDEAPPRASSVVPPRLEGRGPSEEAALATPDAPPGEADPTKPRYYRGPPPRQALKAAPPKELWHLGEASRDRDRGDLRVRVTDGAGNPREDVRLGLITFKDRRARKSHELDLGPEGDGTILGLDPGNIVAYLEVGDLRRRIPAKAEAGRVTEMEVDLPPGATVEGQVRHLEKGPQIGVKIQFGESVVRSRDLYSDRLHTKTDAEGRYRLEEVPLGRWPVTLQGQAIGHHPRPRAFVTLTSAGTHTRDFVLGRVTLRGTVRDAITHEPLPEARVQLQTPFFLTSTTNAEGAYAFRDVPPGNYPISLNRDGYGHRFVKTGAIRSDEVRVADFHLSPAARLRIEVLDAEGAPVAGEFSFSVDPVAGTEGTSLATNLRADENGLTTYDRIVPGTYDLSAWKKSPERASLRKEVRPGDNSVRFDLPAPPDDESTETIDTLRGVTRDAMTRRPIPGVRVALQSPFRRSDATDRDGRWGLGDVPPGPCRLVVFKDGYGIRFVRDVMVETDKPCEVEVLMERAVTLLLRLHDARGDPVVGRATLVVTPEEGTPGTRVSTGISADAEGRAAFHRIVPGRYRLRILKEGTGKAELEADLRLGVNSYRALLE